MQDGSVAVGIAPLKANELKNQWDIYKPSAPVPGPNEALDVIAATAEENVCKMDA